MTDEKAENCAARVLDGAFKVHRELGPGLLESVYETCLCIELTKAGIHHIRQKRVPIFYDGIEIDAEFRLDLVVENCLVIEIKAVEILMQLHMAQLLTYLKITGHHLGLLVNFNCALLKNGIRRVVL